MNALDILISDHQKLKQVMTALETAADQQSDECDRLFQEFKAVFNQHDNAEDKIVYPALKEYPELTKLINKGYQAHHVVEVALLELRLVPYTSESWAPKFSVVKDSILVHMTEEENVLFPQVTKLVSSERLNQMGGDIVQQRT